MSSVRTRSASAAFLSVALLSTACSAKSSTGAAPSSFVPPAASATASSAPTVASPPVAPSTTGAGPTTAAPASVPATTAPATTAPVTTVSPTTTAPLSTLQRQVDTGTVSMAGRKATLSYAALVTTDAEKNAVLTAFGDFERTVMIAFDSHSATLPLISQFTAGQQQQTLIATVNKFTAAHQGSRGVLRYWKARVTEVRTTTLGRVATVTSCGNESKWIGVNQQTGKDVPNDPEDKFSYLQTSYLLNTGDGHWRVTLVNPEAYHVKACP